jgi:hypothetical protein
MFVDKAPVDFKNVKRQRIGRGCVRLLTKTRSERNNLLRSIVWARYSGFDGMLVRLPTCGMWAIIDVVVG